MATIIDGKAISALIREELKIKIKDFRDNSTKGKAPGLAVILVGDDPASNFYVNKKQEACAELGIYSPKTMLPANTTKDELLAVIQSYNSDDQINGILLQLPLPVALRPYTQEILDSIVPSKDVDGLTSYNLGLLLVNHPDAVFPCTPKGCMELLKRHDITVAGKTTLVIGRSTLVGKPISLMLNSANATVTMAHSKTQNLDKYLAEADILVAAIGVPEFIRGEQLKSGVVVLDVGINSITQADGTKKIVGDVHYDSASAKASFITPVPGGVGPMTVAMLLMNTWELFLRA